MSAIPYTVERRPDTGVNNVKLGMWLFLASEAMLFAGLFSAYFMLRAGAAEPWRPFTMHVELASLNTVLLLAAGFSLRLAVRAAQTSRLAAFRTRVLVTAGLGLAFCLVKGMQYFDMYAMHFLPSTDTRMATYFLLTGVHALHVAGGIAAALWLWGTSTLSATNSWDTIANRAEATALYWYFVDLIWLILYILLYVA